MKTEIEIGSVVQFIHQNVNWRGTVMDIRHMFHAPPMLCVASLGYPQMLYVPIGQAILVPREDTPASMPEQPSQT